MGRIRLLPVLLLVWVCGAKTADACGCAPRSAGCGPPAEFWRTAAVFTGQVTAIERIMDARRRFTGQRRVRVHVRERFRGALSATKGEVTIVASRLCSYPFKTGREYLIYAAMQEDGRLTVTVCSRTTLLERAAADLAYARAAAAGDAPPGRIVGRVRHVAEYGSRAQPVPGIVVGLTGQDLRITATTDSQGRYTFAPPAAGVFALHLELPDTLYSPHAARRIEVPDPRACVEASVDVRFNGHINGKVTDAMGRGVPGLTVSHVRPSSPERAHHERLRTLTQDDGTFRIEKVPPGPFLLAVELPDDGFGAQVDAGGAAIAKEGILAGGQRLELEPLALPPLFTILRLEGTVHTTDGAPAPGARVFLKSGVDEGHILGEPAVADSLGRFVIAVLDGERYEVFAERHANVGGRSGTEFSAPVVVNAAPGMAALRLMVRRRF